MLKQTKIEDNELRQTLNAIINKYPNYEYKEDAPVELQEKNVIDIRVI